jgi:hypothetical protein
MNFPQNTESKNLFATLRRFYDEKNKLLKKTFENFKRETVAGSQGEDFSEIDYNNRRLAEVIRKLKGGQKTVEVDWYEPHVEQRTPPKLFMERHSFKLEYRYGHWHKHTDDL